VKTCPTCGRTDHRGAQAAPDHVRTITCWACGAETVQQRGPGRPWVTCRKPRCLAARRAYRKQGGASLDGYSGAPDGAGHIANARILMKAQNHEERGA
jgi:hypothetical protein